MYTVNREVCMEFPYTRDALWKKYLVEESRSHGARFNTHLLLDLLNMYSKERDVLCDPMGGIGGLLVGMTLGCHVHMIELEKRFVQIATLNERYIREKYQVPTYIKSSIIDGDCRKILPLPQVLGISLIITSPPYGSSVHPVDKYELHLAEIFGSTTQSGYGEHPDNIGNQSHELQRFVLAEVYRLCYETLVPGGKLITITKNSIRGGKVMQQDMSTVQACVKAGFEVEEHHHRLCSITARQRLHEKHTAGYKPIDKEDVIVFLKKERDGT